MSASPLRDPLTTRQDGIVIPANGLCPGPCGWRFDRDADGIDDVAAVHSYFQDGRLDKIDLDRNADGVSESTVVFHYRKSAPSKDYDPDLNSDGLAWGSVVVSHFAEGREVRVFNQKYGRGLLFRDAYMPANKSSGVSFAEGYLTLRPDARATAQSRGEYQRTDFDGEGGPGCQPRSIEISEQWKAEERVVSRTVFECANRIRTAATVYDGSGRKLSRMRYDYSCWKGARGCPQTSTEPVLRPKTHFAICASALRTWAEDEAARPAMRISPDRDGIRVWRVPAVIRDVGIQNGDIIIGVAEISFHLTRGDTLLWCTSQKSQSFLAKTPFSGTRWPQVDPVLDRQE